MPALSNKINRSLSQPLVLASPARAALQAPHSRRFERKYRKAKSPKKVLTKDEQQATHVASGEPKHKPQKSKLLVKQDKPKYETPSQEVTEVPDPVPNTGIPPDKTPPRPVASQSSATHSTTKALTTASLPALLTMSFLPLPSLMSTASTKSSVSSVTATTVPLVAPTLDVIKNISGSRVQPPHSAQPFKMSTLAITLLASGSAFVILGLFIIIKACSRPRRRKHPTPSLPILNDDYHDDGRFASDGSPLFGGKERLSPRPGSNGGLWVWPQYSQPGSAITKPVPSVQREKSAYTHGQALAVPAQTPANSPCPAPIQQVHTALTRAASRLSNASTSMYPGSPSHVGIAVGDVSGSGTVFTADGHRVIKRTKSKPTLQRDRYETNTGKDGGSRESTVTRYSQGLAYDGADIATPNPAQAAFTAPTASATGGRSRVKSSYYAAGGYPRASVASASYSNVHQAHVQNPFESQHLPPLRRSDSRKDRDTHLLTAALGPFSPAMPPPSPQMTLYPEDSLSVYGDIRQNLRSQMKTHGVGARPQLPAMSPPIDASAALGSLMLMDFSGNNRSMTNLGGRLGDGAVHAQLASASTVSLNGLAKATIVASPSRIPTATSQKSFHSRTDDKPPRVPSPPPLPSLTQMGLAHANPEAYADYRSPTYSIYGLYESDRKSRVTSFGF